MKKTKESPQTRISLAKPVFNEEMKKAALDALSNERFVLGESVYKFEEEFANYCEVEYAVSTNSGTSALSIALIALGITKGQHVITSPASFIATSNAILHVGARPSFADITLETYNVDSKQIEQAMEHKTKAILPVHLYGHPADMDSIGEIARKHRLCLIEDACQAHGGLYKMKKVGSLGDAGCFSFYPSKNMTVAGDGGMLVTDDKRVANVAGKLRDVGRRGQCVHDLIGYTARLNNVNAAIGRVQLRYLDKWNEKRRMNAERYDRLLSDIPDLILPPKQSSEVLPVYHLYVIRTKCRDELKEWLESNGIQCGIHYPLPIHMQPIYEKMYGFKKGAYPKSEELCRMCLSIPMYADLTSDEINFISDRIHEFFGK